jgi:two-component system, cell cycle response regulator
VDDENRLLQRRGERERQARKQAEQIIEEKSRELFFSQRELRRERDFVSRLIDTARVAILVLDEQGRIVRANRFAAELRGSTADELQGLEARTAFFGTDTGDQVPELLSDFRPTAGGRSITVPLYSSSGERREIEWYRVALDGPDAGACLLLLVGHDVTDRAALFREVERLSITDPLTGLHNRRHFSVAAQAEVQRATRYHRPLSAVMIDIDHFKRVNDTHGHPAGDRVLVEVAACCVRATRDVDIKARLGGEEFCLLLPETATAGACVVAERLRRTIAALRFESGEQSFAVTASFGIAERRSDEDADNQLRRADQALYDAKNTGRNRVATWSAVGSGSGESP